MSPTEYGLLPRTALNFLDRYDEALPMLLQQAEKHQPDAMSWFQVAIAKEHTGDEEGCIAAYKRACNSMKTTLWPGSIWEGYTTTLITTLKQYQFGKKRYDDFRCMSYPRSSGKISQFCEQCECYRMVIIKGSWGVHSPESPGRSTNKSRKTMHPTTASTAPSKLRACLDSSCSAKLDQTGLLHAGYRGRITINHPCVLDQHRAFTL